MTPATPEEEARLIQQVLTQQETGTYRVKLDAGTWVKILLFLLGHTATVIGLAWSYTLNTDRRLVTLEMQTTQTYSAVQEMKADLKAVRDDALLRRREEKAAEK